MVSLGHGSSTRRRILSNLGNALLQSGIRLIVLLLVYGVLLPLLQSEAISISTSYLNFFYIFALIEIVPTFLAYMLSGTILRYVVIAAKNMFFIAFFLMFFTTEKLNASTKIVDTTISITIDFLIPTVMIATIYLIDVIKTVLEAVDFLAGSHEKPVNSL